MGFYLNKLAVISRYVCYFATACSSLLICTQIIKILLKLPVSMKKKKKKSISLFSLHPDNPTFRLQLPKFISAPDVAINFVMIYLVIVLMKMKWNYVYLSVN